ncbi:hypothetical protein J5N97_002960 [Dioscorea zingiberensis]|uniref:Uncharacterized protein n=1 Tax=Dioscorea zingiberensis TaxID=325984 RepID=A0A9D5HPX0_9LILI|nr:hypothetical protein J5N97_002960 [Dioscorea zingiberensis]
MGRIMDAGVESELRGVDDPATYGNDLFMEAAWRKGRTNVDMGSVGFPDKLGPPSPKPHGSNAPPIQSGRIASSQVTGGPCTQLVNGIAPDQLGTDECTQPTSHASPGPLLAQQVQNPATISTQGAEQFPADEAQSLDNPNPTSPNLFTPHPVALPATPKRSDSVDRARPSTPTAKPSVAASALCTTTRNLSVSFQGELFFYRTSKTRSRSLLISQMSLIVRRLLSEYPPESGILGAMGQVDLFGSDNGGKKKKD